MAMSLDQNRLDGASVPRWALTLMCLGALGGALFFLIYTAEGVTRPGYDALTQAISALSLGPGGWVQRANFIGFGLLTIAAAAGWWRALAPGPVAIIYPLLKSLLGVGLVMDGIFSQDPSPQYPPGATIASPPTMHGEIHTLFAYLAIISVALSCFALAVRLARTPGWRVWAVGAVLTGAATMVLISIYGSLIDHGPAGVFERLATGVESVFTLLLVGRLVLQASRGPRLASHAAPTFAAQRSGRQG